jgi:hypothetical protein
MASGLGNPNIAAHGASSAAKSAGQTLAKLRSAMINIEADIERNDGLYPYSNGEVTTAEVLRRAGLSEALLQKARHGQTRREVAVWVARIRKRIVLGAKVVRKAVSERSEAAEAQVREVLQRLTETELEYVESLRRISELEQMCAHLQAQLDRVRTSPGPGNIVDINDHR